MILAHSAACITRESIAGMMELLGVVRGLLRAVYIITKTAYRRHSEGDLCGPAKGRLNVRWVCISAIWCPETGENRLESSGMGLIGRW